MSQSNMFRLILQSTITEIVGKAAVTAAVKPASVDSELSAANTVFSADTTLAAAEDSYDLIGSLTGPVGTAVTFAKVMALCVINKSLYPLAVGGANQIPILSGTTPKFLLAGSALANGALLLLVDAAGVAVTAGTGDLITIGSAVPAWASGVYAINSVVLYTDGVVYKSNKETAETWVGSEWTAQPAQAYELIVIGQAPA